MSVGLALFLVTVLSVPAVAHERQPDECTSAVLSGWTPQEAWVWKQLCLRRPADLNASGRFGTATDVDKSKSWSSQRVLRSSFIEAILAESRYAEKLANRAILISGAWFDGPINLQDSSLPFALYLWHSRFDANVSFIGADISGSVSFRGSVFKGELNLNGAKVGRSVFLGDHATFQRVDLISADIGRNIVAGTSTFKKELDLGGAKVGRSVFLDDKANFQYVNLTGVVVGGNVSAIGSTFQGELDLNGAEVGGTVFLRDHATFQRVDLISADIGRNITADTSTFKKELDLNGAKVGGSVFLRDHATFQRVDLTSADIGLNVEAIRSTFQRDLVLFTAHVEGSLYLNGSNFAGAVICSGGTIEGALSVFHDGQHARWDKSAQINLEGSTISGIDDSEAPGAWPKHISLAGFVLKETRGRSTAPGKDFIERGEAWYLDWLGRDRGSSGQPYKQIETLLRSAGKRRVADAVAMQRMENEYATEGGLRSAIGWLYRRTVGYGYHPEWAIYWIVGLILFGWLILIGWGIADKHVLIPISWLILIGWGAAEKHVLLSNLERNDVTSRLILSAQRLIPLISFGKGYNDVDITSKAVPWWVRWYFYLHATLGYILAAFLLSALARITTT